MFKDFRTWIIIGLAIALIISILTRPKPFDIDGKAYQDSLKVLRHEKALIQSRQHDQNLAYRIRVKQDSVQLARQDSRIQALQQKATVQRTVVQTIIENNPDLESFISTQNEIIHELQVEVDTLKASVEFHKQMHADLAADEYMEDKIEAQMQIDCSKRIEGLEKIGRKRTRGNKLLKVVAVVGTLGGLLVGAGL